MTVKRYLALLKQHFGVTVTRTLAIKGTLPMSARTALLGHRKALLAHFRKPRAHVTLDLPTMAADLAELGFVPLDRPDGAFVYVHPDGDDAGEAILAGVLAPARASTPRERAIEKGPGRPPVENPTVTPVPGRPGTYRYTIRRGQRITRLPTERN